jgi:Putative transposase
VLPRVPCRQWGFTSPIPVRLALSRRPHLVTAALQACLRVLFSWQRRRMRRRSVKASCGAVTFVQRFGSALQLNVHFHVLVPDGAFDHDGVFVVDEVRELLTCAGRVVALLHRFFDDDGRRREIDCLLESLDAASATPHPALFSRTARRAPLAAFIEGYSLHAATRVMASDHRGLWRLCAYGARGALPDGRRQLVMTGVELLEKLVPLIPPLKGALFFLSAERYGAAHSTVISGASIVPPIVHLWPFVQLIDPAPMCSEITSPMQSQPSHWSRATHSSKMGSPSGFS